MSLDEKIVDLENFAETLEESASTPDYDRYEIELNRKSSMYASEIRETIAWLKELKAYKEMDRREYYTVYSDSDFTYWRGGYETLDEAREFAKPGEVIIREVVLKEVVGTVKSSLDM